MAKGRKKKRQKRKAAAQSQIPPAKPTKKEKQVERELSQPSTPAPKAGAKSADRPWLMPLIVFAVLAVVLILALVASNA